MTRGPAHQQLDGVMAPADPGPSFSASFEWRKQAELLRDLARELRRVVPDIDRDFEGQTGRRTAVAFEGSAATLSTKADDFERASVALRRSGDAIAAADATRKELGREADKDPRPDTTPEERDREVRRRDAVARDTQLELDRVLAEQAAVMKSIHGEPDDDGKDDETGGGDGGNDRGQLPVRGPVGPGVGGPGGGSGGGSGGGVVPNVPGGPGGPGTGPGGGEPGPGDGPGTGGPGPDGPGTGGPGAPGGPGGGTPEVGSGLDPASPGLTSFPTHAAVGGVVAAGAVGAGITALVRGGGVPAGGAVVAPPAGAAGAAGRPAPIGSSARAAGGPSVLGRGGPGAVAAGSPTTRAGAAGGAAGRGSGSARAGAAGSAGARSGTRTGAVPGAPAARGGAAGAAGAGRGRGNRRDDEGDQRDWDLVEEDWVDDEGAPGVLG